MTSSRSVLASFRPGVLGREATWAIEDDALLKNGREQLDLSQVTGGHVSYSTHRGVHRRFKIKTRSRNAVIACSSVGENGHQAEMRHFSAQVLRRIAERSPDATFHMGGGRGSVMATFVVALALIASTPLLLSASWETPGAAIIVSLLVLVGGVAMAWSYRPSNPRFDEVSALTAIRSLQPSGGSRAHRRREARRSRR